MGMPVPFFEVISHRCAKSCEHRLCKEIAMSALWLLLLPVAGFVWHFVGSVLRLCPGCNEDFVFC